MFNSRTPISLLEQQTSVLRTQLDGVYDGAVEAVHDARVATRRIRELLALVPFVPDQYREGDVPSCYREVGRALGKVRDVDVQIALIDSLEPRAPEAAAPLTIVRRDYERDRLARMRRLIKTLERLNVDVLLQVVGDAHPTGLRKRLASNGWRHQLRHLVVERAHGAVDAIAHATGVYFPKRAHGARIAIKQVRYASEIAAATGTAAIEAAIKSLRKGQEILGDLHDRQSLADTLEDYAKRETIEAAQVELIRGLLEREVMQLHTQYLARRASLREACANVEYAVSRAWRPGPTVAVGAALAVSGILVGRHALAAHVTES
jgi:CHAD domain-containing protein